MNEFLKMDIFFAVATAAVVVFVVLGAVALWLVVRILKSVDHIVEQVALESDTIRADLATVRADMRRGKGVFSSLFTFIISKFTP